MKNRAVISDWWYLEKGIQSILVITEKFTAHLRIIPSCGHWNSCRKKLSYRNFRKHDKNQPTHPYVRRSTRRRTISEVRDKSMPAEELAKMSWRQKNASLWRDRSVGRSTILNQFLSDNHKPFPTHYADNTEQKLWSDKLMNSRQKISKLGTDSFLPCASQSSHFLF